MGKQPYTAARRAANRKWDEANRDRYSRISLTVKAEDRPLIDSAAAAAGQSVNAWVIEAIRQRMEREGGERA